MSDFTTSEGGQVEETELSIQAPTETDGNSGADVDLSAQIDENNADLADRIKNAINLTHSVAGIAPGVNPASVVQQLESLFPSGTGDSAQSSGGAAAPKLEPLAATSTVPISTAPTAASARQVSRQDLSLLSLFNFLTPSDIANNDPSALMPTPFAPGQSASTLQQQRTKPLNAPTIASAIPVSSLPAAALHLPQYMLHPQMQPQIAQQSLLQQLASAYSAGGQSAPPLAAAAGAGTVPAAFVGGLMQPMVAMNPPDFNFLMAGGYPASLNPGIALIPGTLNPGMMGVLPGLGSFANMGNFMWNPSVMTPMAASYAMASMPHQVAALQEQFNLNNAHGKMPNITSSHNGSASSNLGTDKPLIKSREARWLIRYNELLQVINCDFLSPFQLCLMRSRNTTSNFCLFSQNSFVWSTDIAASHTAMQPIENCHGGS